MIKFLALLFVNMAVIANSNATSSAFKHNDFAYFFSTTPNFQADFTQKVDGKITTGVLSIMSPKHIKWHTKQPDEKILMLSAGKITSYDVWLQSANIIDYKPNTLIELLATPPKDLTQLPSFLVQENGIKYYELENIIFGFKDKQLAEVITTSDIDTQIYIKFSNIVKNVVSAQNFIIHFPPEVDILDESSVK